MEMRRTISPNGKMKRTTKMGRPPALIDWDLVDKLCSIQCTGAEISSVLGIHYDTLAQHVKREFGMSFPEYHDQKKGDGRVSLRRRQWMLAQEGNPTMLIWLGKQYLDQTDRSRTELTGKGGGPIALERRYHIIQQFIGEPKNRDRIAAEWRRRIGQGAELGGSS